MTPLTLIVSCDRDGWFVLGEDRLGPFLSKAQAIDEAERTLDSLGEHAAASAVVVMDHHAA